MDTAQPAEHTDQLEALFFNKVQEIAYGVSCTFQREKKTNTDHLFSDVHVFQHKMTSLAFASCVYYTFFFVTFFGVIEITHFLFFPLRQRG